MRSPVDPVFVVDDASSSLFIRLWLWISSTMTERLRVTCDVEESVL